MKLFLSAGTPRSGSTWLYNAMRLLLMKGHPDLYATWIGDLDLMRLDGASTTLLKVHEMESYFSNKSTFTATCHRDPRDIAASVSSMGWASTTPQVLAYVQGCRESYEFWSARSQLNFSYGSIINEPVTALIQLGAAIGVALDSDEIRSLAFDLAQIPENRSSDAQHDPEFLTHTNHRNDGRDGRWHDQLDPRLAEEITVLHGDWIISMGYDV